MRYLTGDSGQFLYFTLVPLIDEFCRNRRRELTFGSEILEPPYKKSWSLMKSKLVERRFKVSVSCNVCVERCDDDLINFEVKKVRQLC